MRVKGVGDVKFVKNQNASLLSVVGVMNLASHEVFGVLLLEMPLWGFKTWKYKYKENEHKKIFKGWLVVESKKMGQPCQEDLSTEETRETEAKNLSFSKGMKYIQRHSLALEVEDQMARVDIEEEEFHDKQPNMSGSDGEQGFGNSNYWISKVKVVEIHTQHVLLKNSLYYLAQRKFTGRSIQDAEALAVEPKTSTAERLQYICEKKTTRGRIEQQQITDSMYYLAAEEVYRENAEAFVLNELNLYIKDELHSGFGSEVEVAKEDVETITGQITTTSEVQLRGRKLQGKTKQQKLLKSWRFKYNHIAVLRDNKTRNSMHHVALTTPQSRTFMYITVRQRDQSLFVVTWCEFRKHSSVVWHQWRTKTRQESELCCMNQRVAGEDLLHCWSWFQVSCLDSIEDVNNKHKLCGQSFSNRGDLIQEKRCHVIRLLHGNRAIKDGKANE
ncbi:hypothetical protein Rs2_40871 [Raphanus sativus]|nr:hypothetical protein Rs2_40871 [Raphanus sativus]